MIDKSIKITYEMSDSAILEVLGSFIRETRLRQNKTQQELAALAGIERMTLVRIEKGDSASMSTFIRLLRSLGQLHVFDQLIIPEQLSPLQLARIQRARRQRARPKRANGKTEGSHKSDW